MPKNTFSATSWANFLLSTLQHVMALTGFNDISVFGGSHLQDHLASAKGLFWATEAFANAPFEVLPAPPAPDFPIPKPSSRICFLLRRDPTPRHQIDLSYL